LLEKTIILIIWISFGIQIFYFVFFYVRIFFKAKYSVTKSTDKPVSVIICAKNEFENLKTFLPKVLNQKYPVFEVVLVNDASSDLSSDLLNSYSEKYDNLQIVEIDTESASKGKKNAVTNGIEASKYDYLLFTDADCYPETEKWIETMMSAYTENTDIVLGYGGYKKSKGFLNKMIRYDTIFIALKYMSFAKAGFPYMGVGRNLAYKKSVFFKNKGFESHKHIKSGDDDLFVNETANKKNTSITFDYEGITKSIPEKTFKELIIQKSRHLTTGFRYRFINKLILGAESVSFTFFYLSLLIALFLNISYQIIVFTYVTKILFQIIFISFFSDKLKEKKNLIFIPIFDVLIPLVNLYVVFRNIFIKKREWK